MIWQKINNIPFFELSTTKGKLFMNDIDNPEIWLTLSEYATKTRYPGEYEPLTGDDFKEALLIAKKVYHWAEETIGLL